MRPSRVVAGEQQRRDQEAGQDEEQVDPEVSAFEPLIVEEQHRDHRDTAQPVERADARQRDVGSRAATRATAVRAPRQQRVDRDARQHDDHDLRRSSEPGIAPEEHAGDRHEHGHRQQDEQRRITA